MNSKLVFLQSYLEQDVASTLRVLERDLESLEVRLEFLETNLIAERDPSRQDSIRAEIEDIQDRIERTQEDIRNLEEGVIMPADKLVLDEGLQNNIDEIDEKLRGEIDIFERRELEKRRLDYINVLLARQRPVTNPEELRSALIQIEGDQHLLQRLSNRQLDASDLQDFLASDMLAFVDSDFKGALIIAFEQTITNDYTQAKLMVGPEVIAEEAEKDWGKHKDSVEKNIYKLEQKKEKISHQIKSAPPKKRQTLRHQISRIEEEIRYSRQHITTGRSSWVDRKKVLEQRIESSGSVMGAINIRTLEKFELLLMEARDIRMEQVKKYLHSGFDEVDKKIEEAKASRAFSQDTIDRMKEKHAKDRREMIDENDDPILLQRVPHIIESDLRALEESQKEMSAFKANREKIQAELTSDYKKFQSILHNIVLEKKPGLKEQYLAEQKGLELNEDNSPFVEYQLLRVALLQGEDISIKIDETEIPLRDIIKSFEGKLENIDQMPPEELIEIRDDLAFFLPKAAAFMNNLYAEKAHQIIQDLETAKNPDDMKKMLEEKLGREHVEFVTTQKFRDDYQKHTKEGHMVFWRQGDEWKIVIEEDKFNQKPPEETLGMLRQELLHLEYEMGKGTKEKFYKALVEDRPKLWKKIKPAFLDMAGDTNKTPPNGDSWTDEDIVGKLFAMQHVLGRSNSTSDTSTDRLNNMLCEAGLGEFIRHETNNYRSLTDSANKRVPAKVHGFQKGVEAGEEGWDRTKFKSNAKAISVEKATYKNNKDQIKNLESRLSELKKSPYLGKVPKAREFVGVMDDLNNATKSLNEDLKDGSDKPVTAAAVTFNINKLSGDVEIVEKAVGKASLTELNTGMSLLRKIYIQTTFTSIRDWIATGENFIEFWKRRQKEKEGDHAGKLGQAFFGGTRFGSEFKALEEKTENEAVNRWKSEYEQLDIWKLADKLKEIGNSTDPNRFELKAVLNLLATKGGFNLQSEDLWKALNNLQTAIYLKPGDYSLLHDPVLLRQKLQTAFGKIYDYDEFNNLIRTQESSYKSKKEEQNNENNNTQTVLTERLDEILAQAKADERVDPMQYESIIEYCIKNGKSYAENIMFHLIAGMAEGLLAPDRGLALGEHINTWPAMDWFPTMPHMSTADWKNYAKHHFGDDFKAGTITRPGTGDSFKRWYWTVIQNNQKVIERAKASVGKQKWDHDWGRTNSCLGDSNTIKRHLSGRSGQENLEATAPGNDYAGFVMWLEENALSPQYATPDALAQKAAQIFMYEGILDGTAFNRKESDISTRENDAMNRSVPREAGVGRHADLDTMGHRRIAQQFLLQIDAPLFQMLSGREARSSEKKKELGIKVRDYLTENYPALKEELGQVEEIDQVYGNIDAIFRVIFNQMDTKEYENILSGIVSRMPK